MRQFIKSTTIGLFGLGVCSLSALPANAIDLSWQGDQFGYSLEGEFDFNNTNGDDFARASDGEITQFDVTFFDPFDTEIITYDVATLQGFFPSFNFNYQISTQEILQTGDPGDPDGFRIGSINGILLDSNLGTGIALFDGGFGSLPGSDTGGVLEASVTNGGSDPGTPIPFELEGTMGLMVLGGFLWYRNRRKASQAPKS